MHGKCPRHDSVPHAPAGHCIRFGMSVEYDRPLLHTWKLTDAFGGSLIRDTPVDLVGEDPQVVMKGQFRYLMQVRFGNDSAGRILRRIDDDHARPVRYALA